MRAAAERVGWLQASAETGEAVNQAFWIALLHPIPTFMLPVKSASSTDSTINQFNHERLRKSYPIQTSATTTGAKAIVVPDICVSVTIGLGIFIRCGETLAIAGPAGTILAFGLVGVVAICVMDGIAEMVELWPISNPFSEFVSAFVDEDLGIVVGFAYWYTYAVNFQSLLGAAASLLNIWVGGDKLLLYQRTIFWFLSPIVLLGLNYMGVWWVGMIETVLGLAKILFLIALFFLMIAVEYGGVGERNKRSPSDCIGDGFKANHAVTDSQFQALLIAIPTAVFGYIGVETIAITAYEAKNRSQVKPPARLIAWCITGLYLLSAFGSVLSVSWSDYSLPRLYPEQEPNPDLSRPCINPNKAVPSKYRPIPPAVIALENVNSTTGRNALTACLIFVVLSAANAALYVASRTLFGLARNIDKDSRYPKKALTWLAFVTHDRGHRGMSFGQIPAGALVFSVLIFCWLPFIENVHISDVLSSIGTVGSLLVWASQALAYIRFDYLRRRYGSPELRRNASSGQPYYAWVALVSSLVIVFVLNTASWWEQSHQVNATRVLQVYIGVMPSSGQSDTVTQSTELKVEEQVNLSSSHGGREGHETRYTSSQAAPSRRFEEEIKVTEKDRYRQPVRREEKVEIYEEDRTSRPTRQTRVNIEQDRYREPYQRYVDAQIDVQDKAYDHQYRTTHGPATHLGSEVDVTERDYRRQTSPIVQDSYVQTTSGSYVQDYPKTTSVRDYYHASPAQEEVRVKTETRTTVDPPKKRKFDMGYYDDEGQYHSFRDGLHRAADHILHPIHGPRHHQQHPHHHHSEPVEEVIEERETVTAMPAPRRSAGRSGPSSAVSIPCHHIRIGDLLYLQGRPCQVIRITTSSQTGQHRYLGVDLFTKQLQEESSFISNPSPSVVVQQMYGPVFKQYRVLDIRDDGQVVAMTETGDVKQGLPVIDQSSLLQRLTDAFDHGRGSIRVLVLNDEGRELAVDYRVVNGSRL
ncbi:hypothetical protein D6C89_08108 [Aureobasidium pullulans]|uniref:Amino acid permease/ SLC12A domain-containing protein n=1 Tax=Aureobasidium pullulans TaxID=5580 RepID=A0A4S9T2Z5_AURPU|nr:hypothetical protein D6D22_06585 [Aureobasidium pullulans]THW66463.1 hypothetical protein D6D20_01315 [Aureobasidium pullulans]THZ18744.1 hypothetical protein D6C89_08108 [Aureobasidium pullulans]